MSTYESFLLDKVRFDDTYGHEVADGMTPHCEWCPYCEIAARRLSQGVLDFGEAAE